MVTPKAKENENEDGENAENAQQTNEANEASTAVMRRVRLSTSNSLR